MLHDQRASGRSRWSRSTRADFPAPASPPISTSRPSPRAACAAYSVSSASGASRSSSGAVSGADGRAAGRGGACAGTGPGPGSGSGSGSSARSCRKIAASRSRSGGLGSIPSSSARVRRTRRYAPSASAWRPLRYSASISWACTPSSNGCSAVSASSSGRSWTCSPRPSRVSTSARLARSRSCSRRSASSRSQGRPSTSASGRPRHSASASRSRCSRTRPAACMPSSISRLAAATSVPARTGSNRYPGERATITSRLPSTWRRYDTWRCNVFCDVAGGSPPQTDHVGEPVAADDDTAVQCQHRQHRLAAQPVHWPGHAVGDNVNRPEQPDLHPRPRFPGSQVRTQVLI